MSDETKKSDLTPTEEKAVLVLTSYDKLIKILISFENAIALSGKLCTIIDLYENLPDVRTMLDAVPNKEEHRALNQSIRDVLAKITNVMPDITKTLNTNEELGAKILKDMGLLNENGEPIAPKKKIDPDSNLN